MTNLPKDSLLSIQQAADFLKVSSKTLRRWEQSGKLPAQHTSGGHRRYELSSLQSFKTAYSKSQVQGKIPPQKFWHRPAQASATRGISRMVIEPTHNKGARTDASARAKEERALPGEDFLSSAEERYQAFLNLQKTFLKAGLIIFTLLMLAAIGLNIKNTKPIISALGSLAENIATYSTPGNLYQTYKENRELAQLNAIRYLLPVPSSLNLSRL
jgi:excisionase family DNA binding protein